MNNKIKKIKKNLKKIKKIKIVKYRILYGLDNLTEGIPILIGQMVSSKFEEKK